MDGPEGAPVREPRGPVRTCVACRGEGDREDLVRLVRSPDGDLVVDARARLPGRGAWVHPTRECVQGLEAKPGALTRALGGPVDASGLLERIRAVTIAGALDGLSLAAAAGALVGGHDVLAAAIREGRIVEIVVASDASVRTVSELRSLAGESTPVTPLPLDAAALGARVGRGLRAALGVTSSRAASHLRRQLRRVRALG